MIDQGQSDPRLKGYFAPEGITVEIVASEPVVRNPIGMAFASDGALYVVEWVPGKISKSAVVLSYRDGTRRRLTILKKTVKDQVKLLRDSNGKGTFDLAKVVLKDELLSSILIHGGWMYLAGQESVRRYKIADFANKKASQGPESIDRRRLQRARRASGPQVIAQGFSNLFYGSGFTFGNDGWLYAASSEWDNIVEGSDGSRANVLRSGAIFRCRPDGTNIHVFAQGFCSPCREAAFDAGFHLFHADSLGGRGSAGWLMHVMEGNDFGYRRPAKEESLEAGSREGPGKMPALLRTGQSDPSGLLSYNEKCFPEAYHGLLLTPDPFRHHVRAYRTEPKGSSFKVLGQFEILKTKDRFFQPCQLLVGPDGAIYVCDRRFDTWDEDGTLPPEEDNSGRIYRLSWSGTKENPAIPLRATDSWAKIGKLPFEDLVKTFASENFTDRQRAREEIVSRANRKEIDTKKAVPALVKIVSGERETLDARITALGALQVFWNAEVQDIFINLLQDPNPDLRRLAADGLALNTVANKMDVQEGLVQALSDEELSVRRAVIMALGHVAAAGAGDVLAGALQFDDGKDPNLRDGILRAIEMVGRPAIEKVLALADSGVTKDLDKVVAAFRAFRGPAAVEALPGLLKNIHLTVQQKADLVRSYHNYLLDPPISLEPLADYLAGLPRPPRGVKVTAKEAGELKALLPIKLAGLEILATGGRLLGPGAQALLLDMLDETDLEVRIAVISTIAETRMTKAQARLERMLAQQDLAPQERAALSRALAGLKK
jgi:putative membrane-bound dehydrogenase-like protein